ncbi:MAG TPA: MaoC family dehydratase, partial [Burkholderiaceae bacterium]|nr:MaoC family dehydratase [Burkholderiaceae bacterium]
MDKPLDPRLIAVGEKVTRRMRYSRADIAQFARMSLDENPLHLDSMVAQRARFGEIVASGQQTAAILMGMLATHYSRSDDGVARQMICLNMNFAFKAPVFAEQEIVLQWKVSSVTPNAKLKGLVG